MLIPSAFVREPSPDIDQCELTCMERTTINPELVADQHKSFVNLLKKLNVKTTILPHEEGLPDGMFMQDPALVLDEVAILCRLGVESRRKETLSLKPLLKELRPIMEMTAPGMMEGGDIQVAGKNIFVGISTRTNAEGVAQLKSIVEPLGYFVRIIEVKGCLHLGTGATYLGKNTFLINPDWIDAKALGSFKIILIDASEPFAANALRVGENLIYSEDSPKTRALMEAHGFIVHSTPMSEIAKAEGGVTCLALLY